MADLGSIQRIFPEFDLTLFVRLSEILTTDITYASSSSPNFHHFSFSKIIEILHIKFSLQYTLTNKQTQSSLHTQSMNATFTMANICPQAPLLNKGFWAKLEAWLRFMHTQEREFEVRGERDRDRGRGGRVVMLTVIGY
jgi:hypothetical protein